ncbi:MAG: sigma-54-dependent transcriptional regulator [Thermodesulfobacteriota bacterium]
MENALQPDLPIIVVDDDENVARAIVRTLTINGYNNIIAEGDSNRVIDLLGEHGASLVLLDITMPKLRGDELLEQIVALFPQLPVIMATANDAVAMVVHCMKKGAFDYITKPLQGARLLASVGAALQVMELRRENEALRSKELKARPVHPDFFTGILAGNRTMLQLFAYMEQIAPSSQPVLISGETGVGKELAAQAIHRASNRKGRFVAVNVAGLDDEIFADTLFGHARGAFTGAGTIRDGAIKKASGGTLFLDEIGDLTLRSQMKLLRLLQEREYYPLGDDSPKVCDARIIVATNRDFTELLEAGLFRKDLYYRLNAHHVHLPPLRERRDDLPLLVPHFAALAAREFERGRVVVPDELYDLLANYSFPGNVRELRSMIFDAVSRLRGHVLGLDPFAAMMGITDRPAAKGRPGTGERVSFGSELPSMKDIRFLLAREALERSNGNVSLAARLIGLTRQSLSQYVRNSGIREDAGKRGN